jgi:hypothetical protein
MNNNECSGGIGRDFEKYESFIYLKERIKKKEK